MFLIKLSLKNFGSSGLQICGEHTFSHVPHPAPFLGPTMNGYLLSATSLQASIHIIAESGPLVGEIKAGFFEFPSVCNYSELKPIIRLIHEIVC